MNVRVLSVLTFGLILLHVPTYMSRACTERRTNYRREAYTSYYSSGYNDAYSCGWWGWDRCRRTLYRRNSRTSYRTVTSYYTACCSGYTCSTNCQACCSPSCRNGGTCDTPGRCICRAGWEGSVCQNDVNECSRSNRCHRNAECRNNVGSYTCRCRTGYQGNGYSCSDINECRGSNRCSSRGTCHNTAGSYTCSCRTGYEGDGYTCTDINECQRSHRCNSNARCSNTIGSYQCTCNTGYEGSGFYCNDINECQRGTHLCHQQATCTNTVGSHSCTCNTGYEGNGITCQDANECLIGNGGCDQVCTNVIASYQCSCRSGFYLGVDRHSCEDVNECATQNGGCHHNCHNTVGSYHCSCNNGYMLSGDNHTCAVPPLPPTDVRVSRITTRKAEVHWRAPAVRFLNVFTMISSFRIVAAQNSFNISDLVIEVPPTENTYTFPSTLEEFTMYTCRVYAGNSFGYGQSSQVVEFTTLQTIPSAPPRVDSVVAESSSLVSLHWLPPLSVHINGKLEYYIVNFTETLTGKKWTFIAVNTVLRIGSLHPNYVYEYTLTARTVGNGPYSPVMTVRTAEDAPSGWPQYLTVTQKTSTSLVLSWQPPPRSERNGAIRFYTVKLHEIETNSTVEVTSNTSNVNVSSLHPYYHYECMVRAETILPGPYSDTITIQLDEDAPSSSPIIISATAVGSTSVFLEWDSPPVDTHNGIIRSYNILLIEQPTGLALTYEAVNTSMLIQSLHPHYIYKCQVHAFTISMGPPSDPVYVETLEDFPTGAPYNITRAASTSSSLTLTWQQPRNELRNGIITAYHGFLFELPDQVNVANISSNESTVVVDGLNPHTTYEVQIAAENSIGIGPLSAVHLVKTSEDAPSGSPQNVTIVDVGSKEAQITWVPPHVHLHNGIIREYLVEVIRNDRNKTIVQKSTTTSSLVSNLHPDVSYYVKVAGHTVEAGPYSSAVHFHTLQDVPASSPTDLQYENLTSSSFIMLWMPPLPDDQNGDIINYKVNFTELSTHNYTLLFTDSTLYEFVMLNPFTTYSFSIAAATEIGFGPWSPHFLLKTAEDIPSGAPMNLTGYAVDSSSIFLQWNSPPLEMLNGLLRHYQIDIIEEPTLQYFSVRASTNQHLLSLLHPFYEYTISVAASTVGNGPFSDSIVIKTHSDVPSGSPPVIQLEKSSRSLFLFWDTVAPEERNGIITGYTVTITDLDNTEQIPESYYVETMNLTINDLLPYRTYGLLLKAHTTVGYGPNGDLLTVQTDEEAPIGRPTNITAVTFDSTSIHIYWNHPPEDTHYGFIREYRLNITELETGNEWREVVDSESTEAIITSLHPYYTYHITIVPVTIIEGDNYTEITLRTSEDAPSEPPLDPLVLDVTAYSFSVSWEPPSLEAANGIIRKYIINVTAANIGETTVYNTYNTSIDVHGLHPYTTYQVSIAAFTISAGPFTEVLEAETEEDAPTAPPDNLALNSLTSRDLLISWQPPPDDEQNGEIVHYTVILEEENEDNVTEVQTEDLEIVMKVKPFRLYYVYLAASTMVGLGPYTAPSLIEMPEDAPSSAPTDVHVLDVSTSNFTVRWAPPPVHTHNGIIRAYLVNVTELNTRRSFTEETTETMLVLRHLHPYYIYHFTVVAITVSHGPPTEGMTVTTLESVPSSAPTNVTLLNIFSTNFTLWWLPPPPEDRNGIIVQYQLMVTRLSTLDSVLLNTNETEIVVTDLVPYSEYEVIIAAMTREGSGPYTDLFIQTEQDAPSLAPGNLTVVQIFSRSIGLSWSSIESEALNGELSHYRIEIFEQDSNFTSHSISTTSDTTLNFLHPFYTYRIRVSAVTVLPGPFTADLLITTLEDAPSSSPLNIQIGAMSPTAISISWDPPPFRLRNGIIRWYSIHIEAEQPWVNYTELWTSNATELNITELTPYITYLIQINAHTILPGPFSNSHTITTLESAPSAPPSNLSLSILDSSSIELTWLPPDIEDRNGVIRYYKIVIYDESSDDPSEIVEESSPAIVQYLHPFYQYEVEVAAVTVEPGPFSDIIMWMMPEDAPSSAPVNITINNVTSTKFSVQWDHPSLEDQNGVIRGYSITFTEENSGNIEVFNLAGNVTTFEFQDLHPAYTYSVEIAATTVSQGPYSDAMLVKTADDIPSAAPASIVGHAFNSTSVLLLWETLPEDKQNGDIINYTIVLIGDENYGHLTSYSFTANSASIELSTLRPFSTYNVSIAANTVIGMGPFSAPYTFHTPEDAPSSAPTILSVDLVKSTSFVVKWALPPLHEINGYIRYFILNITEVKTSIVTIVRAYGVTKRISDLHPHYNYTLTIAMVTTSVGPFSQPFGVLTEEAAPSAPPTDISVVEVTSRRARISWKIPPESHQNGIIRFHQVRLKLSRSHEDGLVLTTSQTSITLTDLLPYRDYSFTILSATFEPGPESEPRHFRTLEDIPSVAPLLFMAASISTRELTLSWNAPQPTDINGILRKYILSVSEAKSNLFLLDEIEITADDSNITEFTVNYLTPYTLYNCSISAVTIRKGPSAVIQVRTGEEAPGESPEAVHVDVLDAHTMNVSWSAPHSQLNGLIRMYLVNLTIANSGVVNQYTANATSLLLSDLVPYTAHFLQVAAVTIATGPYSEIVYGATPEAAPYSTPLNVSAVAQGSTSINLAWQPPPSDLINGVLRYYRVVVTDLLEIVVYDALVDGDSLVVSVPDLHPYSKYQCMVAAVTVEAGPSASVNVQTLEDFPNGPPTSVVSEASNTTSIMLSWQPLLPHQQNGIILQYRVNLYNLQATNESKQFSTNETTIHLVDLHPFYLYEIVVAGENSIGVGPYSQPILQQLPEARPSLAIKQLNVSIMSPSSVNLLWMPPPRETWNGILTHYTVISFSHGPNNSSTSTDLELLLANSSVTGSTSMDLPMEGFKWANKHDPRFRYTALVPEKLTIDGLHEFFTYEFTIYMSNSAGDSDSVSSSMIQLPGTEPSGPPANIEVTSISSTSISLSWLPPSITDWNGIISAYKVNLFFLHNTSNLEYYFSSELNCVIENLDPYTIYSLTLAAISDYGTGPHSEAIEVMTLEDVPSPPLNVSIHIVPPQQVLVAWDPPQHKNGIITLYQVTFYAIGTTIMSSKNTTSQSLLLSNLTANKYSIKVRAETVAGFGDYSSEISVTFPILTQDGLSINEKENSLPGWILSIISTLGLFILLVFVIILYRKYKRKKEPHYTINLNDWKANPLYEDTEAVENRIRTGDRKVSNL